MVVGEHTEHYHAERNPLGLGNQLILKAPDRARVSADVQCRERLGGLLDYYYRRAARYEAEFWHSTGTMERDLYCAGFTILGFYLLTQSVADGLYWSTHFLAKSRTPMSSLVFEFEQRAQIVPTIVEASMATALIVGSQRLRDWVHRLRNG